MKFLIRLPLCARSGVLSTRGLILWLGLCFVGLGSVSAQDPTPIPNFPLRVGVPVEGNINDFSAVARFTFDAAENALVTVTMEATSGSLDPFLTLLDPDGLPLLQNDDRAPGIRDAQIELALPRSGTYTLEASRFQQQDGNTSGTYRLLLTIAGVDSPTTQENPLNQPPPFTVPSTRLAYQTFGAGTLSPTSRQQYFVIGGNQADLVRVILTPTDGDFSATLNLLNRELESISSAETSENGIITASSVLPATDWYLIEVTQTEGVGSFSLYVEGISGERIAYNGDLVSGALAINSAGVAYTFEGKIGDQMFVSLVLGSGNAAARLRLLDIRQQELARAEGERIVALRATIPRSGTYILQVENTRPNSSGNYNLRLNAVTSEPNKFNPLAATYNNAYKGEITPDKPFEFYTFSGKMGELITAEMISQSALDPFLLLLDANLNELASNNDTNNTPNARITQFSLPADGTYYLVAARAGLALGETVGTYDLTLSAGAIQLEQGALSVTLTWAGRADLNLFIREPNGRILSWSNPTPPQSGTLQVDSNTRCQTLSAQPVEHIYWQANSLPANGDYAVWVWHQNRCGQEGVVDFNLNIQQGETAILMHSGQIQPDERYDAALRVAAPQVQVLDSGRIITPSEQQRISEGGDVPIRYGERVIGSIDDRVYARFYQFSGTAGDEIVIEAQALTNTLDTVLILRDNAEGTLAENDDISPQDRQSRIEYTLPYSGRYVIAVTRYGVRQGTTEGDYRLILRRAGDDAY